MSLPWLPFQSHTCSHPLNYLLTTDSSSSKSWAWLATGTHQWISCLWPFTMEKVEVATATKGSVELLNLSAKNQENNFYWCTQYEYTWICPVEGHETSLAQSPPGRCLHLYCYQSCHTLGERRGGTGGRKGKKGRGEGEREKGEGKEEERSRDWRERNCVLGKQIHLHSCIYL